MSEISQAKTPDRLHAIAEMWAKLSQAAARGDQDAILFLRFFQPCALERLNRPLDPSC